MEMIHNQDSRVKEEDASLLWSSPSKKQDILPHCTGQDTIAILHKTYID